MRRLLLMLAPGLLALCALGPAQAADNTPVASKDGKTFYMEDLNVYWLDTMKGDALVLYLTDMIIYQEGLKLNLRPTDAEMTEYIDNRLGRKVYEGLAQLYSERSVRQYVESKIVSEKYVQSLRDKIQKEKSITVSETEARKFFLDNIKYYHLPEGAYLSIISVDSKAKADEVMKLLKAGQNFNDLAAKYNLDAQMRDMKGELKLRRRGDGVMPKELEAVAFALQNGKYSEVVKGPKNYHILFCHQRSPEVSPTFEEVKESVQREVLEQKIDPLQDEAVRELVRREMNRYDIKAELFATSDTPSPARPSAGAAAKPPAGQ